MGGERQGDKEDEMSLNNIEKRRVITLVEWGWNEHEIAGDLFQRKYPIEYALTRKEIQICLKEKESETGREG